MVEVKGLDDKTYLKLLGFLIMVLMLRIDKKISGVVVLLTFFIYLSNSLPQLAFKDIK